MKAQTAPSQPTAPPQALTPDFGRQLASPDRELASPAPAAAARAALTDTDRSMAHGLSREDSSGPMDPRSVTSASNPSLGERIAERAYFLYLARHGEDGDAVSDWLEAERQVSEEDSMHG